MQYRKTLQTYNDPGHAHELTFSCYQRIQMLDRDRSRRWFVDALESARRKHKLQIWAYVIMPEHVHVLFWPTEADYSVAAIRSSMKLPVAKSAVRFLKQSGSSFLSKLEELQPDGSIVHRFWQRGGGYDRNVFEPKTVWRMIDYIHDNPVRRGLVIDPTDWIWSSARFYRGNGDVPIRMDPLPELTD